ncbi:LuxR C-terminal-related transcriptional regulator [Egicoccus sp. AB-alg2]|uniref:LuxR C-terminal-related transcriptional regulator n=1 Tax=Egicoccus sp. AB-alg2 TaxID=3242693 RepID=UPI00359DE2CD
MQHTTIRLLLVDTFCVVREGVRAMVDGRHELHVVGEAASVAAGVAKAIALRPDVVLVGADLPDGRGADLIRHLRTSVPEARAVVFSPFADEEAFFQAVVAGAFGYLVEDIDAEALATALRAVGTGQTLISPTTIDELRTRMRAAALPDGLKRALTGQEARILAMVVEGATNGEIAEHLSLAEKTVRNYMSNILAKTGTRNRTELTAAVVGGAGRSRLTSAQVLRVPEHAHAG